MPGNELAYGEEIAGSNFTVTVSGLPAGKYQIAIGEAETSVHGADQRLFDVVSGDTILATNFDIFANANGMDRVCFISGEVEHLEDSIRGPLMVNFLAHKNQAKFNTFEIRDASGAVLVALKASDLVDAFAAKATQAPVVRGPEIWKDPSQPLNNRVADLISRMSLAEKVSQMRANAPAIPRLGIPAYHYWNECLHGVADAGIATVFPQAIGMAATWDPSLIQREGDVISTEARAKHNDYIAQHNGDSKGRYGLTFWSPNINLFRDPRWGRGQETYGEDPFLIGQMAVAFIHGLQGDDPKYYKVTACAKHYVVHSGPEPERHRFDARPTQRDLYETYLPAFETAVRQGHVAGVMGAYSALYGVPDCANQFLLTDLLRQQWGFTGYVVSDCGAISDIWKHHNYVSTQEAAAAAAVNAGCDICCGGANDFNALINAVPDGLITESRVDQALAQALKIRFQLGMFDPPAKVPFANIGIDQNDTPAHEATALKVAEESIVLLKNNGLLPLDRAKIKRIAVIGENADSVPVLVGNYNGTPARPVTILAGIKAVAGPGVDVTYAQGCPLALQTGGSNEPGPKLLADADAAAKSADVVIYVGGISAQFEGEENRRANGYDGFEGGDRTRIELPSVQTDLIKALYATGKKVIFVNCSGSALAMPWEASHLPAIVQAWYPGEQGGQAVAEALFGDFNPAGRLPVTFYSSTADLPPFEDYSMTNRTYRYFNGRPLFAFGHGLSYTKFSYKNPVLNQRTFVRGDTLKISFDLENSGPCDGEEVAQIYFRHVKSALSQPKLALCGFTRVYLKPGQTTNVTVSIPAEQLRYWDARTKQYLVERGKYQLLIGAASDDIRLKQSLAVTSR